MIKTMKNSILNHIVLKTGDNPSTVSNYLAGRRGLSRSRALKWAAALDIDAAALLLESPEKIINLLNLPASPADPR